MFRDRVAQRADAAGTGAFTFVSGPALYGYLPLTVLDDAEEASYIAVDGADWEIGSGSYTTAGTELSRSVIAGNSAGTTDPVDFARPPLVALIVPASWYNEFTQLLTDVYLFFATLTISGPGNITHMFGIGDASTDWLDAPSTGFTHTIPDNCSSQVINPAATLAAGTINFPATPFSGQQLYIKFMETVTALTLNGNGSTIRRPVTTATAGTMLMFTYREADTTWY